jgi:3',5'-cyclic AMP phosphodiesterase CpdA
LPYDDVQLFSSPAVFAQNLNMQGIVLCLAVLVAVASCHLAHDDQPPKNWDNMPYQQRLYRFATRHFDRVEREAAVDKKQLNLTCAECTGAVKEMMSIASHPGEYNLTKDALGMYCSEKHKGNAAKAAACEKTVDIVLAIGIDLLRVFMHFNMPVPQMICGNIVEVCKADCCSSPFTPEQLRLNFASRQVVAANSSMQVSWVTLQATPGATVQYRAVGASEWASPGTEQTSTYHHGGWIGTIHTAFMTGLQPATTYTYRVGSVAHGQSPIVNFTTLPLNAGTAERPLRVLNVADMGVLDSNNTVKAMVDLVESGKVDFVIHPGDIGYADTDQFLWDDFGRLMEPIMSRVAYMTTPGNHEMFFNFSAYKHRYQMPLPNGGGQPEGSMYYSFSVGPVAFMMLDSETIVNVPDMDKTQLAWAERQLVAANQRKQFIVVAQHRPLYCSSADGLDCKVWVKVLRKQAEQLYADQGVSYVTCGHVHSYERTYPVLHGEATGTNYTFPAAPVYAVNGAAGNREGQAPFEKVVNPWSAVHTDDIGYVVLTFSDTATTQTMQSTFYRSLDRSVVDDFTLVKAKK